MSGSGLIAIHVVQASFVATLVLGVLSGIAILTGGVVRIAVVWIERPPEIRAQERRTAASKRVNDAERVLQYELLHDALKDKETGPLEVSERLELMRRVLGESGSPSPPATPDPVRTVQSSDSPPSNDAEFQEIVSKALDAGGGRLICARSKVMSHWPGGPGGVHSGRNAQQAVVRGLAIQESAPEVIRCRQWSSGINFGLL